MNTPGLRPKRLQPRPSSFKKAAALREEAIRLTRLDTTFYSRSALDLARDLIGKIIVRKIRRREFRARIVETEAYVGAQDLACHASKGRTSRTEVMFGPAGRAYVYLIYGMYDMFNIVAADVDDPQAVLIRAAEPLDDWAADLSGPGKLARGLAITHAENGLDLTGHRFHLIDNPADRPSLVVTPRIGIDYAGEWKDKLLRFLDAKSGAVSKVNRANSPRGRFHCAVGTT